MSAAPGSFALIDFAKHGPARRTRRAFLTGGAPSREDGTDYWIRVHRRAMACRFEITLASQDAAAVPAARAALDEIDRLEEALSVFRETSTITRINRSAADEPVDADPSIVALLDDCATLYRDTGGAFDITSTPLSRCWGFLQREGRLPSADAIDHARSRVGAGAIRLDKTRNTIRFDRRGLELNLGAIGKGYALDRVAITMRQAGATDALLSAGQSSLLAIGGRDRGWHVDVVSPSAMNGGHRLAQVWLRDAALGTSGAGEQFVIVDGTRYGHVIDPRTGWPASGVVSASAIASRAADADALSTAFLVGGVELAESYCREHADVIALVTPEGSQRPLVFGAHRGALVIA
jgi:thiamine biosynthesis lipoprotein